MRPHASYRSSRRNAAREQGTLNKWPALELWRQANLEAKLPERKARCEKARRIAQETVMFFGHKIGFGFTLPLGVAIAQAVLAFYLAEMGKNLGRAHMRIIKGLRQQIGPDGLGAAT